MRRHRPTTARTPLQPRNRRLTRLVVLGHSGYVSLEAVRWLHGIGATLIQLDRDHRIIAMSGKLGVDRPSLRRAQALASERPIGLQIAKDLIAAKLREQARVAKRLGTRLQLPDLTSKRIARPADLLALEARTADEYWKSFQSLKLRFIEKDQDRIPEHWKTFTSRRSIVSRSRKASQASNPANAMLNYLYAMLEVEARIACLAVGLDPGLGVLHTDHPGRDSLALDLMEPVRPHVDAWVLGQLPYRCFSAEDFGETPNGVCRVRPQLARYLAATASAWAVAVAPYAEHVAQRLHGKEGLSTPLTGARTSARYGRQGRTTRDAPSLPPRCHKCGTIVEKRRATICDRCNRKRHCRTCKASLTGKKSTSVYCGEPCRNKATYCRIKKMAPPRQPNNCQVCGKSLAGKRADALYCGPRCSTQAYRQGKQGNPVMT